ncbi:MULTISPECIES: hypothetical protein [Achromobacter]|uniref:hypothetical protein n=1 Tax=Achromobacter TaxID=222 RepID=UPI0006C613CD|nr:hypothetical protein [Achromobacter xylosoxidans]CUJ39613.1 Uncharacterised protein [Achromobacter xylosoxidans]
MNDHSYTLDRWATPDDPESVPIRFADLRKIERACLGIWAIARIVGNSATEPEGTGAEPLEPWISANLLGGIESLCDHIADLAESAMDGARLDIGVAMTEGALH